jgi:hypothetical protein
MDRNLRTIRPVADVFRPYRLWAVVLVSLVAIPVAAQHPEPPVGDTADRPGFADSPILLGRGHIQVESGFTWEREGGGADLTKTSTWPQIELHAGVTPHIEVSMAWDGLVSTVATPPGTNRDERSSGMADVRLGAKFSLVNRPHVSAALIAYGNLPVGNEAFSSHYVDPRARFAWAISVSDRVGLSGTADFGTSREEDGRVHPKPAASMSLGSTVVRTLNGFIGIVAESPAAGSTPNVWSVEGGAVLALGSRTLIDASISRRFAGGPDEWFVGGGIVRRLR